MLNLFQAVSQCIRNWKNFSGRARRSEFWWSQLAFFIVLFFASFIESFWVDMDYDTQINSNIHSGLGDTTASLGMFIAQALSDFWTELSYGPLSAFLYYVMLVPLLALAVRRLHDINRKGWWIIVPTCVFVIAEPFYYGTSLNLILYLSGETDEYSQSKLIFMVLLTLTTLVSIILWCVSFIFAFFDSRREDNRYGASPKYGSQIDGVF